MSGRDLPLFFKQNAGDTILGALRGDSRAKTSGATTVPSEAEAALGIDYSNLTSDAFFKSFGGVSLADLESDESSKPTSGSSSTSTTLPDGAVVLSADQISALLSGHGPGTMPVPAETPPPVEPVQPDPSLPQLYPDESFAYRQALNHAMQLGLPAPRPKDVIPRLQMMEMGMPYHPQMMNRFPGPGPGPGGPPIGYPPPMMGGFPGNPPHSFMGPDGLPIFIGPNGPFRMVIGPDGQHIPVPMPMPGGGGFMPPPPGMMQMNPNPNPGSRNPNSTPPPPGLGGITKDTAPQSNVSIREHTRVATTSNEKVTQKEKKKETASKTTPASSSVSSSSSSSSATTTAEVSVPASAARPVAAYGNAWAQGPPVIPEAEKLKREKDQAAMQLLVQAAEKKEKTRERRILERPKEGGKNGDEVHPFRDRSDRERDGGSGRGGFQGRGGGRGRGRDSAGRGGRGRSNIRQPGFSGTQHRPQMRFPKAEMMSGRDITFVVNKVLQPLETDDPFSDDFYFLQMQIKKSNAEARAAEKAGLPLPVPPVIPRPAWKESKEKIRARMLDTKLAAQTRSLEWMADGMILGHVPKSDFNRPKELLKVPTFQDREDSDMKAPFSTRLWGMRGAVQRGCQALYSVQELQFLLRDPRIAFDQRIRVDIEHEVETAISLLSAAIGIIVKDDKSSGDKDASQSLAEGMTASVGSTQGEVELENALVAAILQSSKGKKLMSRSIKLLSPKHRWALVPAMITKVLQSDFKAHSEEDAKVENRLMITVNQFIAQTLEHQQFMVQERLPDYSQFSTWLLNNLNNCLNATMSVSSEPKVFSAALMGSKARAEVAADIVKVGDKVSEVAEEDARSNWNNSRDKFLTMLDLGAE